MNTVDDMIYSATTKKRPMIGLTLLVVEDSRFACEALRLMSLRSGARLRRADCLASARRHLKTYRPNVMIVDVGLPDGSGLDLIRDIKNSFDFAPILLATSGDDFLYEPALKAGAHGFIAKPLASISEFQSMILRHFPGRPVLIDSQAIDEVIVPDSIAYRDDLCHALELLEDGMSPYLNKFIYGIGTCAADAELLQCLKSLDIQNLKSVISTKINAIHPL